MKHAWVLLAACTLLLTYCSGCTEAPVDHKKLSDDYLKGAAEAVRANDYPGAERFLRDSLKAAQESNDLLQQPEVLSAQADLMLSEKKNADAEACLGRALDIYKSLLQSSGLSVNQRTILERHSAATLVKMGDLLSAQSQIYARRAAALYEEALKKNSDSITDSSSQKNIYDHYLALLKRTGQDTSNLEATIGADSSSVTDIPEQLRKAQDLFFRGKYNDAKTVFNFVATLAKRYGMDQDRAASLLWLGIIEMVQDRPSEALISQAGAIANTRVSTRKPLFFILCMVEHEFLKRGQAREAQELSRQAISMQKNWGDVDSEGVAQSISNLALAEQMLGHYATAEGLYRQALEIYTKQHCSENVRHVEFRLGQVCHKQKKYAQAEPFYKRALSFYTATKSTFLEPCLTDYALLLRDTHRLAEAERVDAQLKALRAKAR
jgi:tetratricopeptide (TPR) repeat protein